jgi:hypothetical protein
VVTNATTETCNALWLDPFQPAGERERACLENAGLTLLPVRTLDDLRHALKSAKAPHPGLQTEYPGLL